MLGKEGSQMRWGVPGWLYINVGDKYKNSLQRRRVKEGLEREVRLDVNLAVIVTWNYVEGVESIGWVERMRIERGRDC